MPYKIMNEEIRLRLSGTTASCNIIESSHGLSLDSVATFDQWLEVRCMFLLVVLK